MQVHARPGDESSAAIDGLFNVEQRGLPIHVFALGLHLKRGKSALCECESERNAKKHELSDDKVRIGNLFWETNP